MSASRFRSRVPRPLLVALLLVGLTACGTDQPTDSGDAVGDEPAPTSTTMTGSSAAPGADGGSAGEVAEGVEPEPAATDAAPDPDLTSELFPDVVAATADRAADGTWTFSATLSSPYDSPQRYADAWRVVGPDGEVYGVRELAHDHANEQPFTRSQSGIVIPEGVTAVTIEGRDQVSGWGGATVEVELG